MAKKVTEPIFKEIIAENSPNVGRKNGHSNFMRPNVLQRLNMKKVTLRHIIINLKTQRQRKNFDSINRKVTHHIQGSFNKTISIFLGRNIEGRRD